jgi:hypothetical protein
MVIRLIASIARPFFWRFASAKNRCDQKKEYDENIFHKSDIKNRDMFFTKKIEILSAVKLSIFNLKIVKKNLCILSSLEL